MRLSRRSFLIASAGASMSPALVSAQAADWRARVPVVRLGVSSSENEGAAAERHDRVVAYLSRRLGVPRAHEAFDPTGALRDPALTAGLETLTSDLVRMAGRLRVP